MLAGDGRLTAVKLLAKRKRIDADTKDHACWCSTPRPAP